MDVETVPDRFDPDPFTVAALSLAAISLVGQFVQIYKAFRPSRPQDNLGATATRESRLESLEQQVEGIQSALERTQRAAERGAPDVDRDFYQAPLRIGSSSLVMEPGALDKFGAKVADLAAALSGLAIWVNNVVVHDPVLAARLGERLQDYDSVQRHANQLLEQGGETRAALEDFKQVFAALEQAIEEELKRRN